MSILEESTIKRFVKKFVAEVRSYNTAIFAGAGLSMPSGFVNWKELLKDIAHDLGLDIEQETDLISVAQYHYNKHKTRVELSTKLVKEFARDAKPNQNHELLAGMPIHVYWTTNYDSLIEDALKKEHKTVDVKRTKKQLAVTHPGSQATVYKMHGDITAVEDTVLIKDDYETYELERKLFSTCLQGDLISKTFLFVGFSFDDPNLSYILSRIRILLEDHQRQHYCFMKRIIEGDFKVTDFESEDERHKKYLYEKIKQELKVEDLKRYGINVLYVDSYAQITEILSEISSRVKRNSVFISGSAHIYSGWEKQRAEKFITSLSKKLIESGYNIISGFGLGVGNHVISGAVDELYRTNSSVNDRLRLYPFPQSDAGKELWTKYREDMISNAGITLFLFGNKLNEASGEIQAAEGMKEEFRICLEKGCIPVPVGKTGDIAEDLWNEICNNFDNYNIPGHFRNLYQELNKADFEDDKIINTVITVVNEWNK